MTRVLAPSVGSVTSDYARRLEAAGVPSPRHDAEALLAYALGTSRSQLLLATPDSLAAAAAAVEPLIARRAAREPLQHILGTAAFRYLELQVGPGALVPRPETELLIDPFLAFVRDHGLTAPRVVDLGTGTGALALAAAQECPQARVWAVDREPAALEWAARNVAATGLPVTLVEGDLAAALPKLDGTVDVVLSNPPYLPVGLQPQLEPEVAGHDPAVALFSGADGLECLRAVAVTAARLLRRGGLVVVEHGDDQGMSAPACFAGAAWQDLTDHRDLTGRPRYLTAVRA